MISEPFPSGFRTASERLPSGFRAIIVYGGWGVQNENIFIASKRRQFGWMFIECSARYRWLWCRISGRIDHRTFHRISYFKAFNWISNSVISTLWFLQSRVHTFSNNLRILISSIRLERQGTACCGSESELLMTSDFRMKRLNQQASEHEPPIAFPIALPILPVCLKAYPVARLECVENLNEIQNLWDKRNGLVPKWRSSRELDRNPVRAKQAKWKLKERTPHNWGLFN